MSAELKLTFSPLRPYVALSEVRKEKTTAGVYVWGFDLGDSFVPYFVGKAHDVVGEMASHISQILGGDHVIYHKDHLKEFWKYEPVYGDITLEGKVEFFRKRYGALREHLDHMVDSFCFTWAPIEPSVFDKFDSSAQRAVMDAIGRDKVINQRPGQSEHKVDVGNLMRVLAKL